MNLIPMHYLGSLGRATKGKYLAYKAAQRYVRVEQSNASTTYDKSFTVVSQPEARLTEGPIRSTSTASSKEKTQDG